MNKILVLGSGALKIGEAGEFDYSGSQALKAFREEGVKTVLLNPNIATIQTSASLADKIYFLPVNPYFAEKIIKKERPDAIVLSFGGQTALNCGLSLDKAGIYKKYGIKVLGTPIKSIEITENRQLFASELKKIGIKTASGGFATNLISADRIAKKIGFPLIIRSAFALGGLGSAVVNNALEFEKAVTIAFKKSAASPGRGGAQVSLEEYLKHWKEIEYEVVRDSDGNKITVCNMENLDPLGIHTGESIVVAPSQTLNNYQYNMLREISLNVIEHLKIVGECNIQFALNPKSNEYRVIEVNARLSRSSALASKATGYPLAYIAAKLIQGHKLSELSNNITQSTSAFFEPALDYLALKMPRWDLQKFEGSEDKIGSEMKSVGEVMAIGRSFPEVLQKAIRMLETGQDGLLPEFQISNFKFQIGGKKILNKNLIPSTQRLFAVAQKLAKGVSVEKIYKSTGIDPWFLHQIKEIVDFETSLRGQKPKQSLKMKKESIEIATLNARDDEKKDSGRTEFAGMTKERLFQAKKLGFSDKLIAQSLNLEELKVREMRKKWKILPKVKHIDTLAAEYPARTNYLYLTYHGEDSEDDSRLRIKDSGSKNILKSSIINHQSGKKVIVLGSGPYRIGSSVEFDWCSVTCAQTFRKAGFEAIIINCNPETVSTDYDLADKLYFEELNFERVADIYELENDSRLRIKDSGSKNILKSSIINHQSNVSLILSFGGQIPNNIALNCHKAGFKILGTAPESIDNAEDRHKFSLLLDKLEINQPLWKELQNILDAADFARKIGYPVLIRPSYVLSGSAMNVAFNQSQLKNYLEKASIISREHPVVISKFIDNAKEIEIDGVAKNGNLIIYAISEHVENAGVHSGDATIVLPPQRLYLETIRQIKNATKKILKALKINGPFNIQFLAKDNNVSVIELNLRASRSFPFVSKVTGYNFVEIATQVMIDSSLITHHSSLQRYNTVDLDYVAVKAAQFSWSRIKGADPTLRVEMSSTGEVACFGDDLEEAYLKALIATGFKWPEKSVFISLGGDENKNKFLESCKKLYSLRYTLYATEKTSRFLKENRIKNTRLFKISEGKKPSVLDLLSEGKIDLVININTDSYQKGDRDGFLMRRTCVDYGIPLITNLQAAETLVNALSSKNPEDLQIKSWDEYLN